MKKILHYILLAVVCLASSCNNVMDLPYDGRTSLDALFTERRGVRAYLNSCSGYCPAPYMDRASLTDEAQDADDILAGSRYAAWYTDAVSASNYASYSTDGSPWAGLYEGIRHCNVFLERIKGVDPALIQSNADEVGGWTAQAHVLRALYYLQLIKRYGDVPLLKSTYEQNHDYTKDVRAPFSEVVEFIVEDCDAALAYSEAAFGWGIPEASFGIMTRAVPYAIKSQAVTYAASPLWSDGTYDWEDALEVSREALAVLLTHDYKLFDNVPSPGIAQNPYALYFITSSDDRRSTDKETILQVGAQMEVWRQAGLPSTPGQLKAGPCPSQELVDCYETVDGEPILDLANPYEDDAHRQPNYNRANTTYDPQNPYENRDPRFYASIYYNGSKRHCYWKVTEDPKCIENYPAEPGTRTRIIATYPEEPFTGLMGAGQGGQRTRTGYYERKFLHPYAAPTYPGSAGANFKMFRLGEAILNFAEAAAEAGHEDEAIAAVNEIRSRVGMPGLDAGLSGDELMLRIRNERRVELAMEGFRYYDVRRWSLPSGDLSETDRYLTAARVTRNGDGTYSYARQLVGERMCYQNKFLWLPIPLNEANLMTTLTGVNWQNSGW